MTYFSSHIDFGKIKSPSPEFRLVHADGDTEDIINTIIKADRLKKTREQTEEFSRQLEGMPLPDVAYTLWKALKERIEYKEDGIGYQHIKLPSYLFMTKQGDCKSFSLFVASVLQNLGFEYYYRFTGFRGDNTYKHVYIAIPYKGKMLLLDAVWQGAFNTEKPYKMKKDIKGNMTKIAIIGSVESSLPDDHIKIDLGNLDPLSMSEGEFEMVLAADTAKDNAKVADMLGDSISKDAFETTHDAIITTLDFARQMPTGIGCINCPPEHIDHIDGLGSWLKRAVKNIGKVAVKVIKAPIKIATFPARLAVKGILELALPKAAPFFMYLYIPENGMSSTGRRKRRKAQKLKNFITKVIGMKSSHFDTIIHKGIQKRFGKPLSALIESKRISGIGAVPAVAAVAVKKNVLGKLAKEGPGILRALGDLLEKILSVFGKKEEGVNAEDMPSEEDFIVYQQNDTSGNSQGTGGNSPINNPFEKEVDKKADSKGLFIIAALGIGGYLLSKTK